MQTNKVADALIGLAVGDALGVPVEFTDRAELKKNPVTSMRGYGSHRQPPGTWSDDSSLAFCLAESLLNGYNLKDIANNFVRWKYEAFWTPYAEVFDIGIATSDAITKLKNGTDPLLSGGVSEFHNGNGSLMRILPLIFYTHNKTIKERFEIVAEVSAITHAHIRSIISCFIYTELGLALLKGKNKFLAFEDMQKTVNEFITQYKLCDEQERALFHKVLMNEKPLTAHSESEISGSGYVLHTLEASIWCLLTTENYADAVLKAVNLGSDTDTTGCVTGGLAGLYYGYEAIPSDWINEIARKEKILSLALALNQKFSERA